ncbi:SpoIIAA family protein [Vibrio mangrovi]|uniref:STAS/SEC14 domain-containing protein n=1 Tax=Vibrio mangrovi TaxID=474394 RepID=A0A1Y6IQE7_9VIBR|nr:STAS/SEC14 domain-containing protein [Vibrio mangrovi]MDW6003343.1 STAS/SEC14 domain-containing protein [Vibrio mangrovi]SMR99867.1 hypothetical protein VIM7927_01102 [Vibrio mangrovi]
MLKVTRHGINRLDLELSGKIDADNMRTAIDTLISQAEGIEKGQMLYDVVEFHIPSFEAIAIKIAHFPTLFRFMRQFSKVALLTDKNWLQKAGEFEGHLFPGMEIKAFHRDQRDAAEAWLSE